MRSPTAPDVAPSGSRWLWAAAGAGTLHAAFSLFWAAGGTWLLRTVGQWAVDAAQSGGPVAAVTLAGVGLVKLVAAVAPPFAERHGASMVRRPVRAVSWVGAAVLVVYGGGNTLIAALVLTGVIRPSGGYDTPAMIGHALLWDPLFLVWGALLLVGLVRTRRPTLKTERGGSHDVSRPQLHRDRRP